MKKTVMLAIALAVFAGACKKADVPGTEEDLSSGGNDWEMQGTEPEKILQDANPNVKVGVAVKSSLLAPAGAYRDQVALHFNSLSAENDMKMRVLQPQEGVFDFSNYTIQNVAKDYGLKRIHGHTLIWYNSLPQWVKNAETETLPAGTTRAARFDSIMSRHIRRVINNYDHPATQFKDADGNPLMKSWDVVNEVFYDDGTYRGAVNIQNGVDRGSVWYRILGQAHVEKAFRYARRYARANADYGLKLFYNDYGHEYSTAKLNAIYDMVMNLKTKTEGGQKIIDGIGLQFHINYDTDTAKIAAAIRKMASTGLLIHISELDVRLNKGTTPLSQAELDARTAMQKAKYKQVALLYRKYVVPAQRWGITVWSLGDGDSWLAKNSSGQQIDYPCLFDLDYVRKAVFYHFYDGLKDPI